MTKSAALELDWAKPYGTIHGRPDGLPTAMYEQDGFLFDGAGKVLLTKEEKAEQQKQLEAQLAALKASEVTPEPKPAPEVTDPEPGLVEVRDGVTGDVETKTVEEEKKDAKPAKSSKGKGALPTLPE